MTGLIMDEKEFCRLNPKDRDLCLYKNQLIQMKGQEEIVKLIKGYKLNQKIQYFLISFCIAGLGIIFKLLITK